MTQQHTKFWYLKNIDIFSRLRDEDIGMIDQYSTMREIKKGEILFLQGGSDKNFFILKKGTVKITKLTPQGNEIILDIFSGGTVFGEVAVVTDEKRDESAVAVEEGLICVMKKENLEMLMRMMPGLAVKINKMIGLKLWKIENKLIELLYRTVEQRLAKTFLNLLDDFGVPHDNGYLLKVKLTHKDYADLIASTRETVTATLNKFKKEGIIEFEGKYVLLKSLEKIKALAE